jgi:hypothetical protein
LAAGVGSGDKHGGNDRDQRDGAECSCHDFAFIEGELQPRGCARMNVDDRIESELLITCGDAT